ncbi:MAG: NAD(P)/FAD-dependent oxidoreductase, partial [Thermoanaerobaculia bacterium]
MTHHTYLIVGGGMTAAAAVAGIREVDEEGSIGLISAEGHPPYDRPPLSKKLWTGKKQVADLWRPVAGVATYLGRTVRRLELEAKRVTDERGEAYGFDKLLLATGGAPRRLPFGGERVIYFRTLDTYERLRDLARERQRFAVIGGGFIGSEIAAALAMNGKQVTMLFPDAGIAARIFPPDVGRFLDGYYEERGVEVLAGESVTALEGEGTDLTVVTASGRRLAVDGVVAGIGITPSVELAQVAGLAVDDGVVVDPSL